MGEWSEAESVIGEVDGGAQLQRVIDVTAASATARLTGDGSPGATCQSPGAPLEV